MKQQKLTAWLGDESWISEPFGSVDEEGWNKGSLLFKTREEARRAGWNNSVRVEVTIRRVK